MEDTAAYILEKTAPIFNRHGYVGTSLSDLTAATGLTKGAIYCNFENKEDLALKAFNYNIRKAIAPMYAFIGLRKSGLSKLYAVTEYHRNYYNLVKEQGGCPLIRVAMDAKFNSARLHQAAKKSMRKLLNGLTKILEEGISDGTLHSDFEIKKQAKIIYTIIEGGLVAAFSHDDRSFIDQAMQFIDEEIIPVLKK